MVSCWIAAVLMQLCANAKKVNKIRIEKFWTEDNFDSDYQTFRIGKHNCDSSWSHEVLLYVCVPVLIFITSSFSWSLPP